MPYKLHENTPNAIVHNEFAELRRPRLTYHLSEDGAAAAAGSRAGPYFTVTASGNGEVANRRRAAYPVRLPSSDYMY